MIEEELEFRSIPGFDGYTVNQVGQVLHDDKVVRNIVGHGGLNRTKNSIRIMKNDGKPTNLPIAKLVALAFLGVPNSPSDVVKYKDGNSSNFALDNIEWASRSDLYRELYNSKNRYCENRLYMLRKKVCTPIESYQIVNNEIIMAKQYNSIKEAADDLNVSTASISRCLKNPNGMSCGLYWRYINKNETIKTQ